MKHRLKNIANRPIPLENTDIIPDSGEIVEVEMTDRNKYLVKNKFYEDLGEFNSEENKSEVKTEEKVEVKESEAKLNDEEESSKEIDEKANEKLITSSYFDRDEHIRPHKKGKRSKKKKESD